MTDEFLSPTGLLNFFLQMYSKKTHAVDYSFLAIHRTMNSGIVSALYLGVSKAITVLCFWAYSKNNFVLKLVSETLWTVIIWHLCFLACSLMAVARFSWMSTCIHSHTLLFFRFVFCCINH